MYRVAPLLTNLTQSQVKFLAESSSASVMAPYYSYCYVHKGSVRHQEDSPGEGQEGEEMETDSEAPAAAGAGIEVKDDEDVYLGGVGSSLTVKS